jgi:formylglycine-generating enzyme required for sulfatase activity/flavodoxin
MFVFYDFTRPTSVFLAEYASMIVLFAAIGYYLNKLFRKAEAKNRLLKYIAILLPTILSLCMFWIGSSSWQVSSGMTDWQGEVTGESGAVEESSETDQAEEAFYDNYEKEVDDDLIYIQGGTFLMGSPESEDWRSDDETQHEVTVGDFYISAYEVTQKDYQELMEDNPSTFHGENLPVESVSWLDAVRYCNALSEKMGLSCAYEIDGEKVSWNREAEGYRLPTEAEWEYACRAGSTTPFNTENYIGADESNFYGHYPYMIEENYFNQSELSTKPGVYREMTVDVGSFAPNAWGLYDCHGNVGEWVWDYYGEYDTENTLNPTGPENGTMHISRGGGWNDFGKNLRSSYRATSTNGMAAYNVGFRIARGAVAGDTAVSVAIKNESDMTVNHAGKMLIVYYSWSGNTRGVAEEIHRQTGADIFEIELVTPYSTDYNTVLDEAQHDQNIQARPEIVGHIDNMEDYDIVFIGYPNWWASIPMPIASFLDEYDLSGKIIMPFCSHGGGKFGQSLTAISKLEPDAVMMEGLSIHYSGGSELGSNVTEWLCENGIE